MLDIEWNEWGTDKSLPSLDRFVESGGDVNAVHPESGMSLLWLAAEQMDVPLIRRLGELGADPNLPLMAMQYTAVHNAVDIDIDSVIQSQQPSDLVGLVDFRVTKAMVDIGGSIHIADKNGQTPHQSACVYHPDLGEKLLEVLNG